MRRSIILNFNGVLSIRPALIALTSIYLATPSVIFTFFWFKPEVFVPAITLGVALGIYNVVPTFSQHLHFHIRPSSLILLVFVAAFIVYFSGIGGYSVQTYDYWGHNVKFFELANRPWPISYKEAGTFACYYYGYYLVPALLCKFFHGHLNGLVIFWSGLGIYLIVVWYFLLARKSFFALFLFLIAGVPQLFMNAIPFYDSVIIHQCKLYFLGFARGLLWQPHQCIPAALLAALIMHFVSADLRYSLIFFLVCSCLAWGPFVFIGGSGVIFLTFVVQRFQCKDTWTVSKYWSRWDWLSFVYILPLLIYFMSSGSTSGIGTILQSGAYWPLCYAIFLALNLFFFYLLIAVAHTRVPPLLLGAFSFLCVISFFRMGVYNDLLCKASMPALFVIYFEMACVFTERRLAIAHSRYSLVLNAFILVAVLSTIDILKGQFENNSVTKYFLGRNFPIIPYDTFANSYEMLKAKHSQAEANQYLGNNNSVYKKYLSPRQRDSTDDTHLNDH